MNLILCMAGLYRRFREAGYPLPKFLLPWQGTTVLDEILRHLLADGAFDSVLLIANERDRAFAPQVAAVLGRHGIAAERLVFTGDTAGQAETALLGVEALERIAQPHDRRVAFHNIDTVLIGRDFRAVADVLTRDAGWIDTFTANSPAYSYVALNAAGMVTDIAEKIVISPHATTGLYAFASMDEYVRHCVAARGAPGEHYISAVYKRMLAAGARLSAGTERSGECTIILGTPAEYEAARGATTTP